MTPRGWVVGSETPDIDHQGACPTTPDILGQIMSDRMSDPGGIPPVPQREVGHWAAHRVLPMFGVPRTFPVALVRSTGLGVAVAKLAVPGR